MTKFICGKHFIWMTTKYYDIQILYEVMDTLLWRLWRNIVQGRNNNKGLKTQLK